MDRDRESLETNNNEAIIAGDFNIDLLKINNKHVVSDYFDMFICHNFYPKITLPTRLSNNYCTLIDNIFCKLTETMLDTTSGILIFLIFFLNSFFYYISEFVKLFKALNKLA